MEEEINIEESHREIVIPGEIIVSGSDYLPGDGTKREGNDIVAYRYGLSDKNGKLIKIIPLSGVFIPRRGNVIIGRVNDITFNGWLTDIDSAISAFLPLSEVPRYIDKNNLSDFLDISDFFNAKITNVKSKGVDLTLEGKGLGKLEGGIIVKINPNKVPRVIGKEGSMIKLIKDETNGVKTLNSPFKQPSMKGKKCIYCGKDAKMYFLFGRSY